MIRFKKARKPTETLSDLEEYLNSLNDEPIRWLAREVQSWGNEFSYAELAAAIESGRLNELIDWQERYAHVVNARMAPIWLAAMEAAAKKITGGNVLFDTNIQFRNWVDTRGGQLITQLSDESRKAIANLILRGQSLRMSPAQLAREVRPLIGLTDRQTQANQKYREKIFQQLQNRGMSEAKAAARADKAALKYAGKQHRYRAESIVLTENAFAYNRGKHMQVSQAIADGYMGRCAMIWKTAGTFRVCSRCLGLKDTIVGYTDEVGVTIPPLHPRCRCSIMYDEVETPRALRPKPRNFNFDVQRFGGQKLPEGDYNLTVRRQVQNRHIEGTQEYKNYIEQNRARGKSFLPSLLAPNVNAKDLIAEFHGKGFYAPHPDVKQVRERVNTGRIIGQYWDYKEGRLVDTTWIMIVYSNKGTHVYPVYPLEEA